MPHSSSFLLDTGVAPPPHPIQGTAPLARSGSPALSILLFVELSPRRALALLLALTLALQLALALALALACAQPWPWAQPYPQTLSLLVMSHM